MSIGYNFEAVSRSSLEESAVFMTFDQQLGSRLPCWICPFPIGSEPAMRGLDPAQRLRSAPMRFRSPVATFSTRIRESCVNFDVIV
jgi:hypothetical protein